MDKLILLSAFATLTLTACNQASPTTPDETTTAQPGEVDSHALVAIRVREFHDAWSSSSADRANGAKTSPMDTIDLLPPDLAWSSNIRVSWCYRGVEGCTSLDPGTSLRVPLQNGIEFSVSSVSPNTPTYTIIHYAIGSFAPPMISPKSRTLDYFNDSIEITSERAGTRIHYTLDGSYPTSSSPIYTTKIPLDHPCQVKAMAEVPGQGRSLAMTNTYVAATGWNPAIVYHTLIDRRDGQAYPTVRLGNQTWMAKNLNWAVPGGSVRDGREGAVFNAHQVQAGGLCPEGWRVPSRADWDSLEAWGTRQPGVTKANFGNALRSTALLEELRPLESVNYVDLFGFRATSAHFWTSTPAEDAGMVLLRSFSEGSLVESRRSAVTTLWSNGQSIQVPTTSRVRCLKDAP